MNERAPNWYSIGRLEMTISIAEAQARLAQLIHDLSLGEEIILTENEQPIARVIPLRIEARRPRRVGSSK